MTRLAPVALLSSLLLGGCSSSGSGTDGGASGDGVRCTTNAQCDDGLPCTTDLCGVEGCNHIVSGNFCVMGQACIARGAPNPQNPCQKCDPAVTGSNWSPDEGKACNDGQACTHTDKCVAGVCKGTTYSCDDSLGCTSDQCDGTGGCSNSVQANQCLIAGACYAANATDTRNACRRCEPARSVTNWTTFEGPACVATLAGTGNEAHADGPAGQAKFFLPMGVGAEAGGKVFVADTFNRRVRLIQNGQVSTLAGDGTQAFLDGPAASARFSKPYGVAGDGKGKVYVGDVDDRRIRLIENGQVTTFAGTGDNEFLDGPRLSARFRGPHGVAVDDQGRVYVADAFSMRIRVIEKDQVRTLAGDGTLGSTDGPAASARFSYPYGVAVTPSGDKVYVADTNNNRVRLIEGGQVSTFAGTGIPGFLDGTPSAAQFSEPSAVAVDSAGRVYVADRKNHAIRMIANGKVTTLAGNGSGSFADGPGENARFWTPFSLATAAGRVFVADSYNHRIRVIVIP
ncbi:MAG: SMP-30/gluconolactonase/LRE family protein [Deltaproteobacteria bacterium]|nr:SMP-30/gluconolactonase/LRE family protein [Deltaproteobacteria bacterium]